MDIAIAPEAPCHAAALERVLDRAFGPGRHAKVSERVRERFALVDLALSRIALSSSELLGGCRISRVLIGGAPSFFLGPLAVLPSAQGEGLGGRLVAAALAACAAASPGEAVVFVGAPAFFLRLGAMGCPPGRIEFPGPVDPARVLAFAAPGMPMPSGPFSRPRGATPA